MSRRHKKQETEINYKPQPVEPHEDCHSEESGCTKSGASSFLGKYFTVRKRDRVVYFSISKIAEAINKAVNKALAEQKIEVDEKWVKIPRSYFKEDTFSQYVDEDVTEKVTHGRGRRFLNRLISSVEDSKIVGYVKGALKTAKEKVEVLIENTTQFCTCGLKALFQTFAPSDDPYGKLSHYHSLLKNELPDLLSRKTLSNYYKWFEEWRPPLTKYIDTKEERQKKRHSLWEKLIEWICEYLREKAPQYAIA